MSLKIKAIQAFLWNLLQTFSIQGVNFIVSIILARLLLPEDFGLIALYSIVLGISYVIVDSGMGTSLIRDKESTKEDYSIVFFFNVIVALIVYLIIYFSAPLIANFYNENQLINLLRISAINIIIVSFATVAKVILVKELNFKKQLIISLPSIIISSICGIIMALYDFGVWSLVYMGLIQSSLNTAQYMIYVRFVPVFTFNKKIFLYHFNYGYKLTLSAILDVISNELFVIIIGRFYNTAEVGYYNRAESLRKLQVKNISKSIGKITLPLFRSGQYCYKFKMSETCCPGYTIRSVGLYGCQHLGYAMELIMSFFLYIS